MRIKRPNKYRQGQSPERIEQYLAVGLQRTLDDITTALGRLSFADNFKATVVSAQIPGTTTDYPIRHDLRAVPVGRVIIRSNTSSVVDGAKSWDENYIYLSNPSATPAILTLVILG
jgi:hypothetical protein